jgi:hypothetical protein
MLSGNPFAKVGNSLLSQGSNDLNDNVLDIEESDERKLYINRQLKRAVSQVSVEYDDYEENQTNSNMISIFEDIDKKNDDSVHNLITYLEKSDNNSITPRSSRSSIRSIENTNERISIMKRMNFNSLDIATEQDFLVHQIINSTKKLKFSLSQSISSPCIYNEMEKDLDFQIIFQPPSLKELCARVLLKGIQYSNQEDQKDQETSNIPFPYTLLPHHLLEYLMRGHKTWRFCKICKNPFVKEWISKVEIKSNSFLADFIRCDKFFCFPVESLVCC